MGSQIKWQVVIPVLFFVGALGAVLVFRKDKPQQKVKSAQTTATRSDTPLSKLSKKADNDEQNAIDAVAMPKGMVEKVQESFPEQSIDAVKWVQNKYGWEAQFEADGQEIEMEFDKAGNWLETELEHVPRAMIPQVVLKAVLQRFPQAQFKEFEVENTPEGTFYEIEIIDGGQEKEVYYTATGEKKTNKNED